MACRKGKKRKLLGTLIGFMLLAATSFGGCLQDGGTLLQSLNCLGLPTIDKYFDTTTFIWGNKTYLTVNDGNEIALWRIDNPQSPVQGDSSRFNIGNQGDSDYDLLGYSICDSCRWGIAAFKRGNVLFDLGTQSSPNFGSKQFYLGSPRGGFTFAYQGNQYLLATDLPGDCGTEASLYRYNSISDIVNVGCIDVTGFNGRILNGIKVEGGGNTYLYLGFTNTYNRIHIYKVNATTSGSISLQFISNSPMQAYMGGGRGLAVDHDRHLAVTAYFNNGLRTYNISNPAAPIQRAFVAGDFGVVAINQPFIWAARGGRDHSEKTFTVGQFGGNIQPLDDGFWSPGQPWNSYSQDCQWPMAAVFSPDASTMYYARYAVFQKVNFSGCATPQPTPTPTPPPWPTPNPTCVPGCITNE